MRAAVFDLDGTLADTAPDLIGAANTIAAAEGWPPLDPVADRVTAGQGGRALIRRAMAGAGFADEARAEALYPAFLDLYRARIAEETRLFPGAVACLDALEDADWRLGICTNKPEALARLLLDRLGVADRFGALIGADTLPVRKPDPATLVETAARLGARPDRAVLIGDTATDRETARRAGAPCILVRFGYAEGPPDALAPEAVADALSDVAALAAALVGPR
jgi:phosphoglycolate phosphatase